MRKIYGFSAVLCLMAVMAHTPAHAVNGRKIAVRDLRPAVDAYEHGFAKGIMRDGDRAVRLWNHQLIENDGPGAGTSNKGAFLEPVYGERMIKKVLAVDDPRCDEAHVVIFLSSFGKVKLQDKPPLVMTLNGHKVSAKVEGPESYLYVPVQPSWLRKGANEVTFACPEAKDQDTGYIFYIARADEYVPGGGNPAIPAVSGQPSPYGGINLLIKGQAETPVTTEPAGAIGSGSMISTNGGKSWSVKGKGLHPRITDTYGTETINDRDGVIGEYTVRLNLRRFVGEGTLISPVIDLWSEPDNPAALIPLTEVEKLTLTLKGSTPEGTSLTWQIRAGLSMDPYSTDDWSEWITVATGPSAVVEPKGRVAMPLTHWDPERAVTLPKIRYFQWRAVFGTTDPLKSPSVESVSVDREMTRIMEVPKNIMVGGYHNPEIMYSSTGFTYQSADEPLNKIVIGRDDLDKVIEGAGSEFDAIIRLLDYSARRWVWGSPTLEYPKWNTVDISERIDSFGGGGMCIQFSAYLAHILTVMGFHARHVNIQYHEVVEVWSNDFDKWVYLDPTQAVDLYMYDKKTGVPLSLYDMHKIYYEYWGVSTPIDWMKAPSAWRTKKPDAASLPTSFSTTDPRIELSHVGWEGYYELLDFMRMMPRNDFSTTTIPEPLAQGTIQWPWDGYLNWYDRFATPKLQYSWHTDRECDFWPTINRVHFEAVPEINGDMVFITMTTFTPSFKTYQVRTDGGAWKDSDDRYVWRFHQGANRLEMRAVSKFGVAGHPSFIECNFVAKHIPKTISFGTMNQ
ncbi:transglutaminase-like domain-containing protein [bacterium]|nr:transglutaminase-like domain-containing protein [bacterium]